MPIMPIGSNNLEGKFMKKRIVCSALRIGIFLICLSVVNILITAQAGNPAANATAAPTYAMQMMEKYKALAAGIGMNVQFEIYPTLSGEHYDTYTATISKGLQNGKSCKITYFMNEENESDGYSIEVEFEGYDNALIQVMSAITITSINPEYDYAHAAETVQNWLANYSDKGFSSILDINDYIFVLYSGPLNSYTLECNRKSIINQPYDKGDYGVLTYDEVRSGSYAEERLSVTGIVEKQYTYEFNVGYIIDYVTFVSEGKRYRGSVWFPMLPVHFEAGKAYTFYGVVDKRQEDDYACIIITHFEEGLI